MQIAVRDKVPDTMYQVTSGQGVQEHSLVEYMKGKRVVLFGLPGAFTPACHIQHLPDIVRLVSAFKERGFDRVAVTSTNDAFVLESWFWAVGAKGTVDYLADANGTLAKSLGMTFDASNRGMGSVRSMRYALAADDGVVTHLSVDDSPYEVRMAGAPSFLAHVSWVAAKAA